MQKSVKLVVIGIVVLLAMLLSTGVLLSAVNNARLKPAAPVVFRSTNKNKTALDLTSPETTLQSYYKCMQAGDWDGVVQCYDLKTFALAKPVPIKNFQIVKKIVYEGTETTTWNIKGSPGPAQPGDVELQVKLSYQGGPIPVQDDQSGSYAYLLRKFDDKWMIIAHQVRR
ncbi:hypothetical protein EDC14_1005112 [Hydrogenispora ethanolica]|uniref:Uncharacterized protein n=1 Tax=Hydrogenispora ethanolica TaxID=1082276 RepID=A0A4R1S3N7_HYDET|nr:hypothetical protein [Hydrogenispora ethanolica]TCL73250.1 hypothetical protein EDC14_1005112 [Hydrogenispora ethanolica]